MCPVKAFEHYTYDDYCQWEGQWELIEGAPLAITPSAVIKHQAICTGVLTQLMNSIGNYENCLGLVTEDCEITNTPNRVIYPERLIASRVRVALQK